ncbi:MAG TPA: dTDP-glucose 4,6-dehydratase [Bdellovibrionota bacterium]|jgi:dTDP-glucose 4,6-dehydratase
MGTFLVTGAAGFIGSNFVRLALSRGHKVIGLDSLTYAGHRENLEGLKNFQLIEADIRDARAVCEALKQHKPSALLNFAAESHVDRSIAGPLLFVETNVLGTANLLNESLEYWKSLKGTEKENFRYLQVSTDEVFGSLGDTGQFSETTPVDPRSPYSASKTGADHLVSAWHHTYQLPTITTHCSNNYGPFQYPEKLIPHLLHCALSGKPLPVYGKGENVRDWIHVEDHCAGILLALEKGKPGEGYCFGGNAEKRNIDLVKDLCGLLDELRPRKGGGSYSEQISFVKDRLGHDWRYSIDDTKAQKQLGFQRKHKLGSGLRSTIEWYLANESWRDKVLAKSQKGSGA